MPDSLYLRLWFPRFEVADLLPNAVSVMSQFPYSPQRPGITYLALHPVSWNEPTVLERRFEPGVTPEEAVMIASDLLHEDYAYVFEANWDLWTPTEDSKQWILKPFGVEFIVHGPEFEDGIFEREGQVQVDLGSDAAFLHEEIDLSGTAEARVRANIQRLVDFSVKLEKNTQATGRSLWSESEENLAQKLIARLQKVQ